MVIFLNLSSASSSQLLLPVPHDDMINNNCGEKNQFLDFEVNFCVSNDSSSIFKTPVLKRLMNHSYVAKRGHIEH